MAKNVHVLKFINSNLPLRPAHFKTSSYICISVSFLTSSSLKDPDIVWTYNNMDNWTILRQWRFEECNICTYTRG